MLDSPFVRRVAIALEEAEVSYEHLSLATVGQAEEFAKYSPLKRAPTFVLPTGATLFDSQLILEFLREDERAVEALFPRERDARILHTSVLGAALGLGDKAVSALYEKVFHPLEARSARVLQRNRGQFIDTLAWLEERAPRRGFLFGEKPSIADITVGTCLCFAREVHPEMVELRGAARLEQWCARLDALPSFRKTYLAVEPPS